MSFPICSALRLTRRAQGLLSPRLPRLKTPPLFAPLRRSCSKVKRHFFGFAVNHFARHANAGRATHHAGDAAEKARRFRSGTDQRDARLDQQDSGTGRGALGDVQASGRLLGDTVGKGRGHFAERVHDRFIVIVALLGKFRAFATGKRRSRPASRPARTPQSSAAPTTALASPWWKPITCNRLESARRHEREYTG